MEGQGQDIDETRNQDSCRTGFRILVVGLPELVLPVALAVLSAHGDRRSSAPIPWQALELVTVMKKRREAEKRGSVLRDRILVFCSDADGQALPAGRACQCAFGSRWRAHETVSCDAGFCAVGVGTHLQQWA